jgi:hypothetical protein
LGFGFNAAPTQTGTLTLVFLVPDNLPGAAALAIKVAGSAGLGAGTLAALDTNGFPALGPPQAVFAAGALQGSNPTLAAFFNNGASPDNNLLQYLAATNTVDPTATGYDVYTVTAPNPITLTNPGSTDVFDTVCGCLPIGSFAVAFLNGDRGETATANSEALFVDARAVPGPIMGAGLPGLFSGLAGLVYLVRRRRRNNPVTA